MKSLRDFIFILGCNKIKLIKFWILVKQEKFVYQIYINPTSHHPNNTDEWSIIIGAAVRINAIISGDLWKYYCFTLSFFQLHRSVV